MELTVRIHRCATCAYPSWRHNHHGEIEPYCTLAARGLLPAPWETAETCPYVEARELDLSMVESVPLLPAPLDNEPEVL